MVSRLYIIDRYDFLTQGQDFSISPVYSGKYRHVTEQSPIGIIQDKNIIQYSLEHYKIL